MISTPSSKSFAEVLGRARETRCLSLGPGASLETPAVFQKVFGEQEAVIVADTTTFEAAGGKVAEAFSAAGHPLREPFIFRDPDLYAEHRFAQELERALKSRKGIPIAVGSGTINDLTKLAAHRTGRPYMCVATAASMDGYTAFGASITFEGAKQTFECPAPVAVVADLDVICAAPNGMNAWGYADLVAKVSAGADWLLADALGVESVDAYAWDIVQGRLREMISDPAGVRADNAAAIGRLVEGLMLGGFAMQAARSSRPASGAEHQFSHLWDMQHHVHAGRAPSHGFKVGLGTLACTALYERLLEAPLERLDIEALCSQWPDKPEWMARLRALFGNSEVGVVAAREMEAKAMDRDTLRSRLGRLRSAWPEIRERLRRQLIPFGQVREMLQAAGAPVEPEQIGISRARLGDSFWRAYFIRRRFTALDLAVMTGLLDKCVKSIFGKDGAWPPASSETGEVES